nr:GGDEF domain-containing protein [uncultured Acetatifactor sp.]
MSGGKKTGGKRTAAEELDGLTGILKKSVAEARITSMLSGNPGGTLFLCDLDNLRRINNQHGHLAGDECLKEAAQIIMYMIRPGDIFGRRGGDEFLIFMPGCSDAVQAEEICGRIENRFRVGKGKEKGRIPFTVTAVCAVWQPSDTCRGLLGRADEALAARRASLCQPDTGKEKRKDQYIKDANRIRKELIEQIRKPGAYCQDYDTFKGIYRFLERSIIRSGQKACVILITVVDGQGGSLLPHEKDMLMERLGEDIGRTLRIGDVYTRYSSSQYLILVIDTTEGQADLIVGRIKGKFLADSPGNNILVHHCYELQPARAGELMA